MKKQGLILLALLVSIAFFSCGSKDAGVQEPITLRSEEAELDKEALVQAIKDNNLNCPGENITGKIKNQFEPGLLYEDKIVNDHSTGLMWQQDQPAERFNWREVEAYVEKMNAEKFAGCDDWRLPTAIELASLLTTKKKDDFFIDPLFHTDILSTWSCDIVKDAFAGAWFVDFSEGNVGDGNRAAGLGHVRLVRTMN
jgi:hypothetical protein